MLNPNTLYVDTFFIQTCFDPLRSRTMKIVSAIAYQHLYYSLKVHFIIQVTCIPEYKELCFCELCPLVTLSPHTGGRGSRPPRTTGTTLGGLGLGGRRAECVKLWSLCQVWVGILEADQRTWKSMHGSHVRVMK